MLAWFALGSLALVGLWLLLRAFAAADPAVVARWLRILGAILLAVAAILLIWSGRIGPAMIALSFLLPLFMRWRALAGRMRTAAGPAPGQASAVDTRFVAMTLDHDTGALSGTVKEGPFAGRPLDSLSFAEALALWRAAVAVDADSARVIEGWMDRAHGADWRERAGGAEGGGGDGRMTEAEALEILGLERGADAEAIRAAHRRLMMANHPDRGGSTWVAAKINQAKDLLLGGAG
ncbi:MAG: molecular chaperone DnaJ [Alphaproteobacteria bacterium]|nr:molecular chaperone DnaJ [Alphaproteobacteria bacterium]